MGLHDGHRNRLKNRFLNEGLTNFEDHNVLELLLFYSIPRSDTNEIAHELLNKFGSLHGVFEAGMEDLMSVNGISRHSAVLIKMIPELFVVYGRDKVRDIQKINSSDDAKQFFIPRFYGKVREEVQLVLLDDKMNIIKWVKIYEGSVNSANVPIRKIVEIAIENRATNVIIAHNHPTGLILPSKDDLRATAKVREALALVDVKLLDHVIVSDNEAASLKDSGYSELGSKLYG
ncbi:MAG: DNA repair protein RadC [Oscillospiraceae bacterium]|nr:DNA repair protein RadC [Oscillospiraceae bacterium]MDY4586656.1 DNA repair protein RadC [Oscillospiraceae bacterium]